jgi:TetR/AcrR family transcriptional regulator of autoinduction and epiphytic fitness
MKAIADAADRRQRPMTKRTDGRTAKGQRIKELVHQAILNSYIELIRQGVPSPTARETAKQAGLSLRVIFNHFPDLLALRLAAFNRINAQADEFFARDIPTEGSAQERLSRFVQTHARRLEFVASIRRTATMVESIDPDVAEAMRKAREAAGRDLERSLTPALKSLSPGARRELLMKLHIVCSWECWEFTRRHYRAAPGRAKAIITDMALALLAAAERNRRQS